MVLRMSGMFGMGFSCWVYAGVVTVEKLVMGVKGTVLICMGRPSWGMWTTSIVFGASIAGGAGFW